MPRTTFPLPLAIASLAGLSIFMTASAQSLPALADADRAAVYQAAGLQPRSDGRFNRPGCEDSLRVDTEQLDLDQDGRAEVLLFLGPSRCFGESQGGNVGLFMQDTARQWTERLGFVPGVEVVPQGGSHLGLPDLGVANPGGCMLVYRWNGDRYAQVSQRAIQPGGCQLRG